MKCQNCGCELDQEARFCPECGFEVNLENKTEKSELIVRNKGFSQLQRLTFVATGLIIIACFLPFVKVGYITISLMDSIASFLIMIAFALANSLFSYKNLFVQALCISIILVIRLVSEIIGVMEAISGVGAIGGLTYGAYIMIVGVALIFISSLLSYLKAKKTG